MSFLIRVILICACVVLAASLFAEDDTQEAIDSINRELAKNPRDSSLLIHRSRLYQQKRMFDQAVADLNEAGRLGAAQELDREKAELFLAAGWFETGIEHANKNLARNPNDPMAYLVRARLETKLGKIKEAGADYTAALERTKDARLELYIEHAQAISTEDGAYLDQALATIENGIKRIGPVVTLESAALEVELRQANYDAALTRVDQIMQKMTRKDSWLARKGDILAKAGRVEDARAAYKQALDAIEKLTPGQRQQPATKDLEAQLKAQLSATGDLAARPTIPNTAMLKAPVTRLTVEGVPASTNAPALPPGGKTRTYYIAAEETDWDYAPGQNMLQEPFCGDPDAIPGMMPGRIGTRYRKAIYREYTDATFQRLQLRQGQWRHLGILGPLMRAEVGDTIKVVFKNRTRVPASIHPHGVFYLKTSEGSGYNDGTTAADKKDDGVKPGETFSYEWFVPERSGPGPNDPSSLVWLYHSHVHAPKDANAGLIGAMIVTQKGKAKPDGSPYDVDREFITLFNIFDEGQSWYFDANLIKTFGATNAVDRRDLLFIESNKKHAINGYIFANLPLMTMTQGERVRWYLLGMGSEADLHTAHWHGNTVLEHGHRTDVVELLPASMKVADMVADNPGIWMFHCHVNDHMLEGMSARYQVESAVPKVATKAAPPTTSQVQAKRP